MDCSPNRLSLAQLPFDCVWNICLYLSSSFRSIGSLSGTCRTLYPMCYEEFIWKEVARHLLPPRDFDLLCSRHGTLLADALRFRSSRCDPSEYEFEDKVVAMTFLVPGFFVDNCREYVLRSVVDGLRRILSTALLCNMEQEALQVVNANRGVIQPYVERVKNIEFRGTCLGVIGAFTLASSFQLCASRFSSLKSIDLSKQFVRDRGLQQILDVVAASPELGRHLKELNLSDNKLTDASLNWVCNFLRTNLGCGALRVLDLSKNPGFTDALPREVSNILCSTLLEAPSGIAIEKINLDENTGCCGKSDGGAFVAAFARLLQFGSELIAARRQKEYSAFYAAESDAATTRRLSSLGKSPSFQVSLRSCGIDGKRLFKSKNVTDAMTEAVRLTQDSDERYKNVPSLPAFVVRLGNVSSERESLNKVDVETQLSKVLSTAMTVTRFNTDSVDRKCFYFSSGALMLTGPEVKEDDSGCDMM